MITFIDFPKIDFGFRYPPADPRSPITRNLMDENPALPGLRDFFSKLDFLAAKTVRNFFDNGKRDEPEDRRKEEERESGKRMRVNAINSVEQLQVMCPTPHEEGYATDDLTGEETPLEEVREAKREEMKFVRSIPLYEEVPIEEMVEFE